MVKGWVKLSHGGTKRYSSVKRTMINWRKMKKKALLFRKDRKLLHTV